MRRLGAYERRPSWSDFLAASSASRLLPLLAFCMVLGLSIGAIFGDSGPTVQAVYVGGATALALLLAVRVVYEIRLSQDRFTHRLARWQVDASRDRLRDEEHLIRGWQEHLTKLELKLTRLQTELEASSRPSDDRVELALHTDANARKKATRELANLAAELQLHLARTGEPLSNSPDQGGTSVSIYDYEYALELSKLLTGAAADTIDQALQRNSGQASLQSR
jgi:hypothetical protein